MSLALVIIYYLVMINLISGLLFFLDQLSALNRRRRIPETMLHLLCLLGGIFAILPLIYILRHKSKKRSFYYLSWIIALTWSVILIGLLYL